MNVAIVGSRDFKDNEHVKAIVMAYVTALPQDTTIVSGGARGVDSWAEEAAIARNMRLAVFKADWEKFGKKAGYLRNQQIVASSHKVVAFWDGTSKGTQHTIKIAQAASIPVEIHNL